MTMIRKHLTEKTNRKGKIKKLESKVT